MSDTTEVKGWPVPGWTPSVGKKAKQGNGLAKRYFSDGTSKRGWSPGEHRLKGKVTK